MILGEGKLFTYSMKLSESVFKKARHHSASKIPESLKDDSVKQKHENGGVSITRLVGFWFVIAVLAPF